MSHLTPAVSAADHAIGPADAPVTLVEYGDYQCPYCGEAYPVLKAVQRALADKVRFVFRNFPIAEAHPHALHAAAFAELAASSGRFWEGHDLLYEHQDTLDDAHLVALGRVLGLDAASVHAALAGLFDQKIRADFVGGLRSGVNGTPCLFINGRRYDGPRDFDSLCDALEQAARAPA